MVNEVLRPLDTVISLFTGGIAGGGAWVTELARAFSENRELRERLVRLEALQVERGELDQELLRLRELVELREERAPGGIVARVIRHDPTSWSEGVIINRGSSHGVQEGSAVIDPRGVVGQVIVVGTNTSQVLLITDPESGIDGVLQEGRARGVVEGRGSVTAEWRFVVREAPVRVGERVVSSGADGVFPRGLLLGIVSAIDPSGDGLFQSVEVRPAADLSRIEEVLIIPPSVPVEVP